MTRMIPPSSRSLAAAVALAGALWAAPSAAPVAHAQSNDRFSAIVIDLETDEVLFEDNPDEIRYPASLTKMMTLYMLFDALERGEVTLNTRMTVSRTASRQPPSRLGMRRNETIRVEDAIEALAARSANDVAVVVAEHLAGTDSRFSQLMTERARAIGMEGTVFANSNGLPDRRHRTTARDMAVLSEALIQDFPQYYHYFQTPGMTWRGVYGRNHNRLLESVPGVDGLKTGYTRWSGYNLATSAERNGRRIVAVVLGGQTSAARNAEMENLVEAAYETLRMREIEGAGGAVVAVGPAFHTIPIDWTGDGPVGVFTAEEVGVGDGGASVDGAADEVDPMDAAGAVMDAMEAAGPVGEGD